MDGIEVKDAEGNTLGHSQKAAQTALSMCALSRAVLPAPVLMFPPLIFAFANKLGVMPTGRVRFDSGLTAFF